VTPDRQVCAASLPSEKSRALRGMKAALASSHDGASDMCLHHKMPVIIQKDDL
jgi:hypothetical protein